MGLDRQVSLEVLVMLLMLKYIALNAETVVARMPGASLPYQAAKMIAG